MGYGPPERGIGKLLVDSFFVHKVFFFLSAKRSKNSPLKEPFLTASLHGISLNLVNSCGISDSRIYMDGNFE